MFFFINSVVFLKEVINLGSSLLGKEPWYFLLSINNSKMNHKYWNYHTVCGGLGGFGEERILIIANEYC